jgi:hypothetical protein
MQGRILVDALAAARNLRCVVAMEGIHGGENVAWPDVCDPCIGGCGSVFLRHGRRTVANGNSIGARYIWPGIGPGIGPGIRTHVDAQAVGRGIIAARHPGAAATQDGYATQKKPESREPTLSCSHD